MQWSLAVALISAATLGGCAGGVLEPRGPIGTADAQIMLDALAIMLVIVVPTIAAALIFAWWFRSSNARARYRPNFVYSGRIEITVWGIPILVIMFLGGLIWIGAHNLDPFRRLGSRGDPTEVQVISLDWKWLFIYPEQGMASVNELVIPAAIPVHFSLTSDTVMNSFFIPQLGSMIATMNRMVTQLQLEATEPGSYYGESAQFSGDGFSDMHFLVRAVPQDAFAQWVAAAKQSGPVLDRTGYSALSKESQDVRPFTYRSVEPNLFQAVVTQQIPPGAGPQVGRPNPTVHPIGGR